MKAKSNKCFLSIFISAVSHKILSVCVCVCLLRNFLCRAGFVVISKGKWSVWCQARAGWCSCGSADDTDTINSCLCV